MSFEQVTQFAPDGTHPQAGVVEAIIGLYGVTYSGGAHDKGAIYKTTADGSRITLYSFSGGRDGSNPIGGLVLGSDGAFYGTTSAGGGLGKSGTIFKVTQAGIFTTLRALAPEDGTIPICELAESNGLLYGTASSDGSNGLGTIFRISLDGNTFEVLHNFSTDNGEGFVPKGGVLKARDGNFYGITAGGGPIGSGTIYQISATGVYSTVHGFASGEGAYNQMSGSFPHGELIQGDDNALYGTTTIGGAIGSGTVFRCTTNGDFSTLHTFDGGLDGGNPQVGLILGADHNFYGTAKYNGQADGSGAGTLFSLSQDGTTFTVLHAFAGGTGDGANPDAPLFQTLNGDIYGSSLEGGAQNFGVLFKLSGSSLRTVHHFGVGNIASPTGKLLQGADGKLYGGIAGGTLANGSLFAAELSGQPTEIHALDYGNEGGSPNSSFVKDADGNIYGTTNYGGQYDAGVVFKLTPAGIYTVLYEFNPNGDGNSVGDLLLASDGNLYGVAGHGGTAGHGEIFKLSTSGGFNVIYTFTGGSAGDFPNANLSEAADGFLYGSTHNGIFFKIAKDGTYTSLHAFNFSTEGGQPDGGVLASNDGNFYGVLRTGGAHSSGSIYKVTAAGAVSILYAFVGDTDGNVPAGVLVEGADGRLYGITENGGLGFGTAFAMTKEGLLTTIVNFDGIYPNPGLMLASDGNLYGTGGGGLDGTGVIYRLTDTNHQPVAATDEVTISANKPVIINVIGNDNDADNDSLTVTHVSSATYGTVQLNANGTITYSPAKTFPGHDSFTYTVGDGQGGSASATVTITNPFQLERGNYAGLVSNIDIDPSKNGGARFALLPNGKFTGKLLVGQLVLPILGTFDLNGDFTKTIIRNNRPNIVLNLHLDPGADQITGTIEVSGSFVSNISADLATYSKLHHLPSAGTYTILFPPDTEASTAGVPPKGFGYGRLVVSVSGGAKFTGVLGDGAKVSVSTTVAQDGTFPFFAPLYASTGSIAGTITFRAVTTTGLESHLDGTLQWVRPADTRLTAKYFVGGFSTSIDMVGSPYVIPAKIPATRALNFANLEGNGLVSLSDGNLPSSPLSKIVTLGTNNKVVVQTRAADNLTLSISASTGLLTGSFFDVSANKARPFKGVIFQDRNLGAGFFLGISESGAMTLEAQ